MITSPSALRFKFAANTAGKDKNWDFNLLATRYKDREGTIEDVKRHVSGGHALCAGLLGGKRRSKANVIGSQWLLLDIDNSSVQKDESGQPVKGEDGKTIKIYDPQLTLDAALAHPFIQKHCALIYTTASHRPDWHKFRLVFLLPEYVEGADTVEACTRFLMQHLPHDPACKDASRVFYGNSKAEFPLVQPNATLPLDWVRQARETAQKERIEHAEQVRRIEERKRSIRERADVEDWDTDALIQKAVSFIPPRVPNSGNYQECLHVLMALYAHYGVEAEVIAESWSPSIKGTTWNVRQKIRSFRGGRTNGISIGTLFHIAKQYGFKFPKREFTPYVQQADVEFYTKRAEEFEEWESDCDRHTELQQQESFKSFFSNRLEKLKKFLSRTRPFKGFGQPAVAQNKRGDEVVEFAQNEHIATIQALAQQAAAENRQLIVLDASEGGTGKSHLAGELTPQALGVNTIFYTSPNHRNPTVASIEQNYTDLPVRHDGLVSDDTQLTPSGNPYVRWAKPGEETNVEGNCSKAHLFQTFGAKGYKEEVSAEASINSICGVCKWKSNCAGAEGLPTIPRHTFRQDRRNALANDRIRCNLDSLPDIAKMQGNPEDENQEPNRVAVVVDEFTQFRGFSETQANLSDFDNAWMCFKSQVHKANSRIQELTEQQERLQAQVNAKLAESEKLEAELEYITAQQHLDLGRLTTNNNTQVVQQLESEIARLDAEAGELIEQVVRISDEIDAIKKNTELLPGAIAALEPTIFALRSILNGEHDITSETRYGWNEAAVRGLLGDLTGLEKHLAVIRSFNPKLAALLKESDSVTLDGMSADDRKGSAPVLKAARKLMQREVDKENREAIANMPSNCVVPLLEILLGEKQGSFRIAYKDLTIFTRDDRHRQQLKQADFTLILDGTKTRESLAQDLGIDPSEIVVIRQKRSAHANLKIIQVSGMGLLGRDRSQSMQSRVKAITNAILEQHGEENVGVIDHGACIGVSAQEAESGYWFHDNRGSNRFEDKTALLTFGTPFPNIGQLQLEYTTLTGDRNPDEDNAQFAVFVQQRVQSEVAQGGWRLRSSRREGDQMIWYVVSDQDLSYLREYFPDAKFELKTAFEITPSAGSLGEQSYWAVLQASKQVIESGKELTTKAIAQIVGCHRTRISQIAKEVAGGFDAFQRVLMFLLRGLYRTTNTPQTAQCGEEEVLSEEELFAAKTYLPLVLEETAETPEDGVKQILESAESLGKESFERVLRALTFKDRAQLLGQMLTLLPQDWQQEFLDLGRLLEEHRSTTA